MELPKTLEELTALITAEVTKATGGIRAELTSEREAKKALEKQLAELKAAEDAAKANKDRADLEAKGKYEEALKNTEAAYQKKLDELNQKLTASDARIKALVVDGEILKHAAAAVDPQDALALIKGAYQFEVTESGVAVKKSDGTPLLDAAGKPGDIGYAVKSFLDAKPHLVKADAAGGSGARGGQGGGGVDFSKLNPTERLARGHELNKK